jgi:myo-inositol-1(or 4)-monophosphatase
MNNFRIGGGKIMKKNEIDHLVVEWLAQAKKMVFSSSSRKIMVETKTSRNDLVTELDRQIEKFLVTQIKNVFPTAQIISEESHPKLDEFDPQQLLWIIDPIDGTMNFVKTRRDFAIMIGVYQNNQGQLGYIYDVMNDCLYHGGPERGVFCNQQRLLPPANLSLNQGLLETGALMLLHNRCNLQKIALASNGVRIYGSAGIQIIRVLTGQAVGYVSHLKPWDLAAGRVLAETLGLTVKTIDGHIPDVLSSVDVLVASKNAQEDIVRMAQAPY